MGTPDFAVESLRALVEGGYNVVGVVTMPDKPIGRHQTELSQSAVKKYAVEKGLTVLQPESHKDEKFLEELRALKADIQVVVAFRMLPEVVWKMPRLGTFNLHASLLPRYRGAAPINWAIINGDTETGITTFFLQHEIDTGNVIQQVHVPIADTDNLEDVHDRLMLLGGKLVTDTLDRIESGNLTAVPQSEIHLEEIHDGIDRSRAPKIFKDTCKIDWTLGVKRCYDFIRGLSPYPGAWTEVELGGKLQTLKIFAAEKEFCKTEKSPGQLVRKGKNDLCISCPDGYLHVKTLQLAGKKRMGVEDFLRGYSL